MPREPGIYRRMLVLGRHMHRDLGLSAALDERLAVVALVGPSVAHSFRASTFVVLAWVSLQRCWHSKSTSGLRSGGVPLSSSLRLNPRCEAPCLNRRAVCAVMFVAGELAPPGAELDAIEEGAGKVFA
jgi:hypothetical protein